MMPTKFLSDKIKLYFNLYFHIIKSWFRLNPLISSLVRLIGFFSIIAFNIFVYIRSDSYNIVDYILQSVFLITLVIFANNITAILDGVKNNELEKSSIAKIIVIIMITAVVSSLLFVIGTYAIYFIPAVLMISSIVVAHTCYYIELGYIEDSVEYEATKKHNTSIFLTFIVLFLINFVKLCTEEIPIVLVIIAIVIFFIIVGYHDVKKSEDTTFSSMDEQKKKKFQDFIDTYGNKVRYYSDWLEENHYHDSSVENMFKFEDYEYGIYYKHTAGKEVELEKDEAVKELTERYRESKSIYNI